MRCKACDCIMKHSTTQELVIDGVSLSVDEVLCSGCRRSSEIETSVSDFYNLDTELLLPLGNGNYITEKAGNPDDL